MDQLSPSVGVLLQLQLKYVSGTVLSPDIITDPKMAEAFYLYNVVPNDKKNSFSPVQGYSLVSKLRSWEFESDRQ